MSRELLDSILRASDEDAINIIFKGNDESIIWIDWGEDDDEIAGYFEGVLNTGSLTCEFIDVETKPGYALQINYNGESAIAPLIEGVEDRHITIHTINQLINPEYQIRVCVDSNGCDTLAFIPLQTTHWDALESKFGEAHVRKRFAIIREKPNLFTEPW